MLDPVEDCLRLAASGREEDIEDAISQLYDLLDTVDTVQQGRIHVFLCEMHAEFARWDNVREHAEAAMKLPFVSAGGWCWLEYVKLQTIPDYFTPVVDVLRKLEEIGQYQAHEFSGLQLLTMLENTWQGRKFLKVALPWIEARHETLLELIPDTVIAMLERNLAILEGQHRYESYARVVQWPGLQGFPIILDFYCELIEYCESFTPEGPLMPVELHQHAAKLADLAFMHDACDLERFARRKVSEALMYAGKFPEAIVEIDRLLSDTAKDDELRAQVLSVGTIVDEITDSAESFTQASESAQLLFRADVDELKALRLRCVAALNPKQAIDEGVDKLHAISDTASVHDFSEAMDLVLDTCRLHTDEWERGADILGSFIAEFSDATVQTTLRGRSVLAYCLARRTQWLYQMGNVEEALLNIRRALDIAEVEGAVKALCYNVWEMLELDRFGLDMVSSVSEGIQYLLERGQHCSAMGDWGSAIHYLDQCMAIAQHSPVTKHRIPFIQATVELGVVREAMHDKDLAQICYRSVLALVSADADEPELLNCRSFAESKLATLESDLL
ncbi:MAG: hypothetical protein Q4A31_11220 [Corynebacterium sp.]|uniref:hypothetical protein n=1 Tax=Corynebacterium sp. TaxID=1720 RepID=UPI0026DD05EF|nr:hypothetical protein [Corynebacterium sp.]MDO4762481.1 hypothetical protein [Corynebacterium sp.]